MALIMPGDQPPPPPVLPEPYPRTEPPTGLPPIADNAPRGHGTTQSAIKPPTPASS